MDDNGSAKGTKLELHERGRNPRQPIYQAVNKENALENLLKFEEKWGKKYPYAVKVWQNVLNLLCAHRV